MSHAAGSGPDGETAGTGNRRPDAGGAREMRPGTGFAGPDTPAPADLYKCVHCGFCLSACPTYLETGLEAESPRGRIALMKAVHEGRTGITDAIKGHWDLCLQCRACEVACPSGVPYGRLMEATRASVLHSNRPGIKERTARTVGYRWLLEKPAALRTAARAMKVYQRTPLRVIARGSGLLKIMPGGADKLDRNMPRIGDSFFRADGRVVEARGIRRARVAMLAGCVMTVMHANALEAAVRVLARNGVEVVVSAGQGCCGALNAHAGERDSARKMARKNIDSFLSSGPDAVIVASAGCGSTMKEYAELLHGDAAYAEKAARVGQLTKDIHEFLAKLGLVAPVAGLNVAGGPEVVGGARKVRVAYQDACHLASAQRIRSAPRELIRAIPGVELVEFEEATVCCGSAGTYSITQQEMSASLGRRKAGNIAAVSPDIVATANPGCALQVENYLRDLARREPGKKAPKVQYVVELLDEAYRAGDAGARG